MTGYHSSRRTNYNTETMAPVGQRNKSKFVTVACLVGAAVIVGMINFSSEMPFFESSLRGESSIRSSSLAISDGDGRPTITIPASLDAAAQRRLSIYNGNGQCTWMPPEYDVPDNINFYKTLIVGFPSCDKRMTFTQMEALTGWPARDEWDFIFYPNAPDNHPFIKSNYPHHEGYWSWGMRADQVVLVVRNIRRTMVEYHDIMWDIATEKNSPSMNINDILYRYRPPIDSFFEWRDYRVMDEIQWYGWFIDYWMEGGLQRDIFSHKITTSAAWPYYPGEIPTRPDCLDDPWHKHATEPNTCTNIGDYTPPTQFPTKSPTPLPTVSPSESPTLLPTPEDKFLKVFITSETYQGNLGGVEGADLKCQTLATNANLTGTFKAWLSDSSGNHPDTTYLKAGTPYYLMDGTIIANSYQDLISGNIVHAIEVNELGEIVQVNENSTDIVWTSTDGAGGSYAPNYCTNFEGTAWESNSFEDYGGAGQFNNGIPGAWSYVGNSTCDMFHRLYCFEQNDYDYVPREDQVSKAPRPGPGVAPLEVPPPAPIPFLFTTAGACCDNEFPGEVCNLVDACPTPAPTPVIQPSYDRQCSQGKISDGCEPIAVISAEKLRDLSEGPQETINIANALAGKAGIQEYLISDDAWNCIWDELIVQRKGNRMVMDRDGYQESDYNFSAEMLQSMITELTRLINKYSSSYWSQKGTAVRLVQLLTEHRDLIQEELTSLSQGQRTLTERDFLGPEERARRRRLKAEAQGVDVVEYSLEEKKKHFEYFMALEEKVKAARREEKAREREEQRKLAAEMR